ncbi:MAG TPA: hypothetical protein VMM60_15780 [Ilumatobacter sp.]|nr:hypothetical protein [Ilumatobacter sp.]
MSDDPQDQAESLDEDVVDTVDDLSGDEYGDGLPSYPPDRPMGSDTTDGESLAERAAHEADDIRPRDDIGQLVDEGAAMGDTDRVIADAESGIDPSPEAAAMHIERDTGER